MGKWWVFWVLPLFIFCHFHKVYIIAVKLPWNCILFNIIFNLHTPCSKKCKWNWKLLDYFQTFTFVLERPQPKEAFIFWNNYLFFNISPFLINVLYLVLNIKYIDEYYTVKISVQILPNDYMPGREFNDQFLLYFSPTN